MRYIYHYSSTYQVNAGSTNYIDGIAELDFKIQTMDEYKKLKKLITDEHDDKLTILSLSLLQEKQHD